MALPQLLGKQQWDCSSGILRPEIISFSGDHMDHLWEETGDNQKPTHPSLSLVLVGIICLVYWYTKVRAILTQVLKPRPPFVSQLAHQPPTTTHQPPTTAHNNSAPPYSMWQANTVIHPVLISPSSLLAQLQSWNCNVVCSKTISLN